MTTIKDADYIMFDDEGEVVESGTMEQLIARNGRFCRYWEKQNVPLASTV